jgi:predicted nucleic acid-binding Zn ribbon protein
MNTHQTNQGSQEPLPYRMMDHADSKQVAAAQTHCWFCNKPLNGFRRFCSKDCEEAIYEDNETALKRRRIFGCEC